MDLASILHQIDNEISRLQYIREIVQGLAGPRLRVNSRKPRRLASTAPAPHPPDPVPEVVILPPKQKREYRPRLKAVPTTPPRALAPALSQRPVFVPRASVVTRVEHARTPAETNSLEALVRQNLFGGIA